MLSTSPWYSDGLNLQSSGLFSADLDIETFGNDIDTTPPESGLFASVLPTSSGSGFSVESSVASSDCASEDLYSDVTSVHSDFHSSLQPLRESLTSPFMCLLDDPRPAEADHGTFYWSDPELDIRNDLLSIQNDLDIDTGSEVILSSLSSSPRRALKHKRKRSQNSQSQSGDNTRTQRLLSGSERLSLIQDLTETVSHSLGLREQLEVMRIIQPHTDVTDSQLVIDLHSLDDEKLQKVQNFISVLRRDQSKSEREGHVISDSCSECNVTSQHAQEKRMTKKKRRQVARQERQRLRKDERQQAKEERSGLFTREEVMSLSGSLPEQCAEVDILT